MPVILLGVANVVYGRGDNASAGSDERIGLLTGERGLAVLVCGSPGALAVEGRIVTILSSWDLTPLDRGFTSVRGEGGSSFWGCPYRCTGWVMRVRWLFSATDEVILLGVLLSL